MDNMSKYEPPRRHQGYMYSLYNVYTPYRGISLQIDAGMVYISHTDCSNRNTTMLIHTFKEQNI